MPLTINRIIVHEIQKDQRVREAHLVESSRLMPINGETQKLAEKLNASFSKDNIFYAHFKREDGHQFKEAFSNYTLVNTNQDTAFLDFSRASLLELRNQLRQVTGAKGGYFVFVDYFTTKRYLGVFLIRDTDGILFSYDETSSEYSINTVTYLNIEKLAMACRIDIEKYLEPEADRYLSFFKQGQEDISQYFTDWIAADRPESSREFTTALTTILDNIELPINSQTGSQYDVDEFNDAVYTYINGLPGKYINIRNLSEQFFGDPNRIGDYAQENDLILDTEFRAHVGVLRNFKRYSLKGGNFKLNFSKGDVALGLISILEEDKIVIQQKDLHDKIERILGNQEDE
ncbi:MAG: nucleoid-associated protein [Cyclobacteriaceae bacterium]